MKAKIVFIVLCFLIIFTISGLPLMYATSHQFLNNGDFENGQVNITPNSNPWYVWTTFSESIIEWPIGFGRTGHCLETVIAGSAVSPITYQNIPYIPTNNITHMQIEGIAIYTNYVSGIRFWVYYSDGLYNNTVSGNMPVGYMYTFDVSNSFMLPNRLITAIGVQTYGSVGLVVYLDNFNLTSNSNNSFSWYLQPIPISITNSSFTAPIGFLSGYNFTGIFTSGLTGSFVSQSTPPNATPITISGTIINGIFNFKINSRNNTGIEIFNITTTFSSISYIIYITGNWTYSGYTPSPPSTPSLDFINIPSHLALAMGINILTAGLICGFMLELCFVLPVLIFTDKTFIILIFAIMGLCTGVVLGWLPYVCLILIVLIIALLYSNKIRVFITGSGEEK